MILYATDLLPPFLLPLFRILLPSLLFPDRPNHFLIDDITVTFRDACFKSVTQAGMHATMMAASVSATLDMMISSSLGQIQTYAYVAISTLYPFQILSTP